MVNSVARCCASAALPPLPKNRILLPDLMHFNRRMQEELLYRMRRLETAAGKADPADDAVVDAPRVETFR